MSDMESRLVEEMRGSRCRLDEDDRKMETTQEQVQAVVSACGAERRPHPPPAASAATWHKELRPAPHPRRHPTGLDYRDGERALRTLPEQASGVSVQPPRQRLEAEDVGLPHREGGVRERAGVRCSEVRRGG